MMDNRSLENAMKVRLEFPDGLPPKKEFDPRYRRAPNRVYTLNEK